MNSFTQKWLTHPNYVKTVSSHKPGATNLDHNKDTEYFSNVQDMAKHCEKPGMLCWKKHHQDIHPLMVARLPISQS